MIDNLCNIHRDQSHRMSFILVYYKPKSHKRVASLKCVYICVYIHIHIIIIWL